MPFVVDMSAASQARGAKGLNPRSAVVRLPRAPLAISVYLPMGFDTGAYKVSLKREHDTVWSGTATAHLRGQRMAAKFQADLRSYPSGRYTLCLSSKTEMNLAQDVDLEERAK